MAIFIVVGCANAVNLLDGLDSLVSVSIIKRFFLRLCILYCWR